jgi:hypothetical protein
VGGAYFFLLLSSVFEFAEPEFQWGGGAHVFCDVINDSVVYPVFEGLKKFCAG